MQVTAPLNAVRLNPPSRQVAPPPIPQTIAQIVRHVEAWDISATQALLLLLRPSERAVWRQWGRRTP